MLTDGYWTEPEMGHSLVSLAKRLIKALDPDQSIHCFVSLAGFAMEIQESTVLFYPSPRELEPCSGRLIDEHRVPLLPTTPTGRVPMHWWLPVLPAFIGQAVAGWTRGAVQNLSGSPN